MYPIKFLENFASLRNITAVGSILAPVFDNRLVPYPYLLIWVVTRRCNSRCQMCNIWQEKDSTYLSIEQVEGIFTRNNFSFVRSLALTGGEPTLRSDLPQLFKLALESMPNLEHISLQTNGLNTKRSLKFVSQMLDILSNQPNKVYRYDVQISLDGVGEIHDKVRGISGFFNKVKQTIAGLKELQKNNSKLNIKLNSVLMPDNMANVQDLVRFAKENKLPVTFNPVAIYADYYNNLQSKEKLSFYGNPNQEKAHQFFLDLGQKDQSNLRFYYQDMANMVQGATRNRRCMMGYFGFVLEHDGNVYPCNNCERVSFGNLLTDNFEYIWFQSRGGIVRAQLRDHCCQRCTSMCFPAPVNAIEVLEFLFRKFLNKNRN